IFAAARHRHGLDRVAHERADDRDRLAADTDAVAPRIAVAPDVARAERVVLRARYEEADPARRRRDRDLRVHAARAVVVDGHLVALIARRAGREEVQDRIGPRAAVARLVRDGHAARDVVLDLDDLGRGEIHDTRRGRRRRLLDDAVPVAVAPARDVARGARGERLEIPR